MKRAEVWFACCVVLLLPSMALGYTVSLNYGWQSTDVDVRAIGDYQYVGVEGTVYSTGTLGTLYEVRGLPSGYQVDGYRVVREEWEEIGAGFRLGAGIGEEMHVAEGDQAGGVAYVGTGDLMGYKVMVVEVNPVRVVSGVASVLRDLKLEVDCVPGGGNLRVERRSTLMDNHLAGVLGKLYDGVGVEGDWRVEGYKNWVSDGPSLDGGVVDCVIVTSDALQSEFERLAGWHDRLGVRTVVRTLSWIDSHYRGSDGPERIREFLKDAYQKWGTVYLLIGGDASIVPIRYAWTEHYNGAFIPTDHYYSNIEGTWNADGDNIFGEWGDGSPGAPGDGVTFYPQLMVGRAPVRTASEVHAFVDKVVSYAVDPAPGFPASAMFLGEVIFPQDWKPGDVITLDGGAICDTAAKYFPAGWDSSLRYQRNGGMTRTTCLDGYSYGYNYNIIAGHGDAFRTSAAAGDPPYLFTSDFDTLHNEGRYGFTYALNCNNAAVDVDCVFRHLLIAPSGGNMAAYATTRYDFPNVGQYFLNEFLDYVFWRGVTGLGEVCALHSASFIPSALDHDGAVRWTMLTYVLLGDPVIRLWAGEPAMLAVADAGTMALNDSLYTVQVTSGGSPVDGALVTLVGDGGEYGSGLTDAGGMTTLRYRPEGLGWADLTVSGEGLRAYCDSVNVTGSTARLYVSGVTVADGTGWNGNNDGQAGWGERVGLGVGLRNCGSGSVGYVIGNLRAVRGCSLQVDVTIDGAPDASRIHIGEAGSSPAAVPFGLGVTEDVFGRAVRVPAESIGCWIWLDALGWHVRLSGEGDAHTYQCMLDVDGEMLGFSGYQLEPGDSAEVAAGHLVFGGTLGADDYEDGIDLVVGDSINVVLHTTGQAYGTVGGTQVIRYFDTEFGAAGVGDGAGVWFEMDVTSTGGSWKDWFRVEVLDGRIVIARIGGEDLGSSEAVICGLRNVGGGALRDVQGKLRGLAGVQVVDSMSAYGDLASGAYAEGDGFEVIGIGGPVRYQLRVTDHYGRVWVDTVDVRSVSGGMGLRYESGEDYVEMFWTGSEDSLFSGYDIYRADQAGGPYACIGSVEGYARYVDGDVASEESYYYYVRARDLMGNVSAPSETLEAWTGAPSFPGFPVGTTNVLASSVVAADLDRDGDLEIIVGSKDECVYVWHHDGTLAAGWPRRTGDIIASSPAVANLDADSQLEVVIGCRDGYLYAYNYDGTPLLGTTGKFRQLGGYVTNAALDDLDGDRDFEVVAANNMGQVYAWHHNGTGWINANGYFAFGGNAVVNGPTLADIDNDNQVEIILATTGAGIFAWNLDGTGVLQSSGKFATMNCEGSVAVGDIDHNGDMELVAGATYGTQVVAYSHAGLYHPGWPQVVDNYVKCGPALAELDGDGKLDIVVGTCRKVGNDSASVYIFSDGGALRAGWPKHAHGDFYATPVVADIDGDLEVEIIACCTDGRIYAWHKDGTRVHGWPRNFIHEIWTSPAVCDLEKDGDVDLVMAGYDGLVHAFDIGATYNRGAMEWPRAGHDIYNSNLYNGPSRSDVPPIEPPEAPSELSLMCYPSPALAAVHLRLGVPSAGASERLAIEVFDVRGRLVKRVLDKALDPGYHDIQWDGTDDRSVRVSSGIYFVNVSRRGESRGQKVVLVR